MTTTDPKGITDGYARGADWYDAGNPNLRRLSAMANYPCSIDTEASTGLSLVIRGRIGKVDAIHNQTNWVRHADTTLTLADNATNYVFRYSANEINVSSQYGSRTDGWDQDDTPVALVPTVAGQIDWTHVEDWRPPDTSGADIQGALYQFGAWRVSATYGTVPINLQENTYSAARRYNLIGLDGDDGIRIGVPTDDAFPAVPYLEVPPLGLTAMAIADARLTLWQRIGGSAWGEGCNIDEAAIYDGSVGSAGVLFTPGLVQVMTYSGTGHSSGDALDETAYFTSTPTPGLQVPALGVGAAQTTTSPLHIVGIPTSSSGLVSGDIWSNGGVLTII